MAFFLLLYVIGALIWAAWTAILLFHAIKYKFPEDKSGLMLVLFGIGCAIILLFSIIFIAKADWTTVPTFLKSV